MFIREGIRLLVLLLQHRTTRRLLTIAVRAGTAELERRLVEHRTMHTGGLK